MTTTTVKTIGSGGDYTTLQSWEDAAPANLVTSDVVWQGQIISAATGFTGASTLLTMSGSTSDATRYKELTAAAGASFADNANIQTNALRYNTANGCYITASPSYGPVVSIGEAYARVNRVQIAGTSNAHAISITQATALVDHCILEGVKAYVANGIGTFSNSLVAMRGSGQARVLNMTTGNMYGYNLTVISVLGSTNSIGSNNYGVGTFQNCAFFGVNSAVKVAAGSATYTTCYTDVASPPTGCTQVAFDTSTGSGFENITNTTHDFRLKATSALIGVGTTDATNAATDIAGTARPSGTGYDVGAWEYVVAGGAITATTSLSAAVQAAQTATASVAAAIQQSRTTSADVAAAIQIARTVQASVDGAIQAAATATATVNAYVQSGSNVSASINAAVQAAISASVSMGSAVQVTRTGNATLDAAIQSAVSATASLGAAVQAAASASASVNAYVQAGTTASANVAAAVQAAQSASASVDSAIAVARSASASLAAAIAVTQSVGAAVHAAVQASISASVSLGAYVYDAGAITTRYASRTRQLHTGRELRAIKTQRQSRSITP